jgi:CDP-paratose synthetase
MKILITGATGFLGSHLLHSLITDKSNEVVIIKRSSSSLWRIRDVILEVTSYNIDKVPLESVFSENEFDVLIHTATNYGRDNNSTFKVFNDNLLFSMELLELSLKYKVSYFLNIDTFFSLSYDYLYDYTLSKKQFVQWGEKIANASSLVFVNLKMQHLYGPNDDKSKFIPWFIEQLKLNVESIDLTAGTQKRDFIHVFDVVRIINLLLDKLDFTGFKEIEIGTGEALRLSDFLLSILKAYQKNCRTTSNTVLNFGAVPMRTGEPIEIFANLSALNSLGFSPCHSLDFDLLF